MKFSVGLYKSDHLPEEYPFEFVEVPSFTKLKESLIARYPQDFQLEVYQNVIEPDFFVSDDRFWNDDTIHNWRDAPKLPVRPPIFSEQVMHIFDFPVVNDQIMRIVEMLWTIKPTPPNNKLYSTYGLFAALPGPSINIRIYEVDLERNLEILYKILDIATEHIQK